MEVAGDPERINFRKVVDVNLIGVGSREKRRASLVA